MPKIGDKYYHCCLDAFAGGFVVVQKKLLVVMGRYGPLIKPI
jgi:hypothetical protein